MGLEQGSLPKNWVRALARPLQQVLPGAVWRRIRALATAVSTPIRFSRVTGHWKSSLRMAACAQSGEPLPWYTYPAIDFLAQRDLSGRHILEFGGGQSTLWWAKRAASVLTIEEDADWAGRLRAALPANVTLHHVPVDQATRTIAPIGELIAGHATQTFDVIIIDGHLRRELVALAFERLAPGGAIILDNAEGYGFHEAVKGRKCQRVDFFGFAPGVSLRHATSLVFGADCFLLSGEIPIAAIES